MDVVELEELFDEARGVIERGAQLLDVGHAAGEHRIADHRAQFGELVRSLVADDVAPVDLVVIGERHQQPYRQAALVVLQQVHVARADAEHRGHLRLGLLVLAPQLAQLRADERFGHRPLQTLQHYIQ